MPSDARLPVGYPDPKDFYFPPNAGAILAERVQENIYASSHRDALYPYMATLETRFERANRSCESLPIIPKRFSLLRSGINVFHGLMKSRQRITGDVLVIGECHRASDLGMMFKLVLGLQRLGLRVIYLTDFRSPEYRFMASRTELISRTNQVLFVDPYRDPRISKNAEHLLRQDFAKLDALLPNEVRLKKSTIEWMRGAASNKAAWDIIAPRLETDVIIVRNHFHALSASAALQGVKQGKTVVSFQHGIISVRCSFVPIIATHFVAFGVTSANLFEELDKKFMETVNSRPICSSYIHGGSLIDDVIRLKSGWSQKTVLVIDQGTGWAGDFYGISHEFEALLEVTEQLAYKQNSLKKLIVRLHPDSQLHDRWLQLAQRYPEQIEISCYPRLQDDLARASVVLGLFSGAQITAAASGIPALFLWDTAWYYTPELMSFKKHAFFSSRHIIERIDELMTDGNLYEEERQRSLMASQSYYTPATTQNFDEQFVRHLVS